MRAAGSSLATVRSFSATAAAREPALVCSWQTKRPAPEWNRRVPPEFLQSRAREGAETGLAPSPSAVARTARVQRAKRLIDETDKSMVEIAVLAGFGSLRRFNAVFAEVYRRPPTKIRRTRRSASKQVKTVADVGSPINGTAEPCKDAR